MTTTPAQPSHVTARLFDGRSARAQPVNVWFLPGPELVVQGHGFEIRHPASELRLDAALGETPRFLHLPGGQSCEFADLDALDGALAGWPKSTGFRRKALGWRVATVLLLGLLLGAWLTLTQGLPFVARQVAAALPASTMEKISEGCLSDLDESVFQPSRLPAARREALLRRSRAFLATVGESPDRHIEFRSSPEIGANAMALPSGVIVFTDDLVRLARNDEQILAVLAHECGHLHHRHSLRGILQSSAVAMGVTMAVGKQSAADSLQAALTSNLINSRYSREFEFEADAYGAELLRRANIPASRLGEILDLLEKQSRHSGHSGGKLDAYLQSHPSTPERKRRLDGH